MRTLNDNYELPKIKYEETQSAKTVQKQGTICALTQDNLSLGFFYRVKFKPACSSAETSQNIEISIVAGLDMILSN